MSRRIHRQNLTGPYALEAESDYDQAFVLRVDDGGSPAVDLGPLDLSPYDPSGTPAGGGFVGELRNKVGGTLLASATVSMRGARASSSLTITGNASDGETVTIGSAVYTFKNTPAAAKDILIGADAEESLENLIAAIEDSGDQGGPEYYTGTTAHLDVRATKYSSTRMDIEAKTGGTAGNAIATATTWTGASWTGAAMAGGTGKAGFNVHFDGEDIPTSLISSGTRRACVFDVFGVLADSSAVKLTTGTAHLNGSSTDPHA